MENSINKSKRIDWLDTIKGLSILLVCFSHFGTSERIFNFYSPFFVSIFFVVAGYLMSLNKKDYSVKEFVIKKLKAYMYPYCVLSLCVLVFELLEAIVLKQGFNGFLTDCIYAITFRGIMGLWFLPVLFASESIFYILIKNCKNIIPVSLISFLCLAVSIVYSISPKYIDNLYIVMSVFLAIFYLYFGYFFVDFIEHIDKKYLYLFSLLSCFVLVGIFFLGNFNPSTAYRFVKLGNPLLFFFCSIISIYSVIILSKAFLFRSKIIRFFGVNSLIVMAFHTKPFNDISYIIILILKKLLKLNNFFIGDNYIAYVIDMLMMILVVFIVNKYASFLIKIPNKKRESH